MFQSRKIDLALLLFLVPFLSSAQTLSASKLSAHLIGDYTAGSSNIVAGHPRVLKVLALDSGFPSGMVEAMRDYKAVAPTGKIIVRVYSPHIYSTNDNASAAATNFWTTIIQPALNSISPSDRALIDYFEGPNEGQTPTLGYPSDNAILASQWFNQFWTNLTPKIVAAGYKPCIGSIAVGNPGGSPSEMQSYLAAFVPALRQASDAGGAWSYHAYTINYTTDFGQEYYYSLRYRQFYDFFAAQFPDLANMPLILTEGGVDFSGDPNTSGWQARGTQDDYKRWLNWFDHELAQDSYVLGCTLFQNGDPAGWSSFDLEPIAGWMKNYLLPPTNVPPAPSGLVATPGTTSVGLTWANAPLNPTTYTVLRSQTSGGVYLILATNITTGVLATTFTDDSVTNGGTYFYRISATNAFGQSAASTEVTATITPLPDVTISSVVTPLNPIYAGDTVTFRATVKNQGALATPTGAGKGIGIGFHLDGDAFFCYHGAAEDVSLAPGSSMLFFADGPAGAFTWPATLGRHTIDATVDDIDRFFEADENNNSASASFDVGIRINGGGGATTSSFLADTNFSGGATFLTTASIDTSLVNGVAAPLMTYLTERHGNFSYLLTNLMPDKVYALRLHFMELSFTNTAVGQRVFNVSINGSPVLTNFDIWAEAGARFKAIAKRFHVPADASGKINVQFDSVVGQAQLNGLDLITTYAMANATPAFLPISNQVVNANSTLTFTAKAVDGDQPFQTLSYGFSVAAVPPVGANINPTNGVFTWTPSLAQAGTNSVSLVVSDGTLFAAKSFQVIVVPPPHFSQITNAPDGTLTLNISAFAGKTYRVEFKNNLEDAHWTSLGDDMVAGSNAISVPDSTLGNAQRFYRVLQLN